MKRDQLLQGFGTQLASYRHSRGLTQEALAERSGLHRTYIGGLERGERNPTLTTLMALTRGFELDSVAKLMILLVDDF